MNFVPTVIASVIISAACSSATAESLRIGTEGAYPPFNFIDDAGEIAGFERDFGDELCRRIAMDCVWVTSAWDAMIPNLLSDNYDIIIATMGITPERKDVIDFSEDYLPPEASGYAAFSTTETEPVTVAVQVGTIQASFLATTDATVVEFPTIEDATAAMQNGQVDAVFAGKQYLDSLVSGSDGQMSFIGEDVVLNHGAGIGVRQGSAAMLGRLNSAIGDMKADGTINALILEWLGEDAHRY